jgi:membrane-associated phospholipid phosphatase
MTLRGAGQVRTGHGRIRDLRRLLAGLAGFVVIGWLLALVGNLVLPDLTVTGFDARVTDAVVEHRAPLLTRLSIGASWLADLTTVTLLVVGFAVASHRRSGRWAALWFPGTVGAGALLMSAAVKVLTGRPRPQAGMALGDAFGAAFPSGHSLRAMAVFGAIALITHRMTTARAARIAAWSVAGLATLAVGFSRVYLGVHWLSDVVAGFVLGGAWLAFAAGVILRRDGPAGSAIAPATSAARGLR